jgi:hypothetical protein
MVIHTPNPYSMNLLKYVKYSIKKKEIDTESNSKSLFKNH